MTDASPFPRPPADLSVPELELELLERWRARDVFRRSVEQRRAQGAPAYVFYDGPPFANGLPHYGHMMTSYVKDTIPRYFTMRGNLVERRWGWDCHGLPVELAAQQELGLRGVKEINDFGVGRFNEVCRNSVFTYADEWRKAIDRIGRWVDWDDQYRTMDLSYMETVMHIFHALYRKGLIYESYKVLAYCWSCQTPLSNFETRLDDSYRERVDPTVTVGLPLLSTPSTSILVWTTTPWTLPSNVLAAISPTMSYETWRNPADGTAVVLAASSRAAYATELEGWELASTDPGERWIGEAYEPVFDYFADTAGAFRVVASDIVTEGEGTGVVHIAPSFGEDDSRIGRANDVIGPQPVRDDGTFDERVRDFAGMHVLDANAPIQEHLSARGRLFAAAPYAHPYPHCWRCDSPLIYRAIDSWMVSIEKIRHAMHAANDLVHWIPEHVGPGAMGHGIESAPDWALTRNRFWGSPVPVWKCDRSGHVPGADGGIAEPTVGEDHDAHQAQFVPASVEELARVSGLEVTDLHRPEIDAVTWPCPNGDGVMRRVPDVLDCWFESGSMPFAQTHWMGEPVTDIAFPADFIVEYVGQVRGWFYTLLTISSALTGTTPFRNCIAHGILLGDDNRKLSKRLRNFPDPEETLGKWGSDALRASLLASPIMRGGDGAVSIDAVRDAHRALIAPLLNTYTFFATYARTAGYEGPDTGMEELAPAHPLDRYALALAERLRADVQRHLDAYDLARAYDALSAFCEDLTNWYVRLSRRRFWEPTGSLDRAEREPFDTLHHVLWRACRVIAPLLPFVSEWLALQLGGTDSVHLDDWPAAVDAWADDSLLADNATVRRLVTMARALRAEAKIGVRQPLARLLVVGVDAALVERYAPVLQGEVNVKAIEVQDDAGALASRRIVPDPRTLGPRLGAKVQEVLAAARRGEVELADDGSAVVAGERLDPSEFSVSLEAAQADLAVTAERDVVVALDLAITPELALEGHARQLVRRVQDLRKQAGLEVADRIRLSVSGGDVARRVVAEHGAFIAAEVLAVGIDGGEIDGEPLARTDADLDGEQVGVSISRA